MLSSSYLAQKLTPYPLPTKDGGVLRTIGDARAYMMVLPKKREQREGARWVAGTSENESADSAESRRGNPP
jgi:hypothetical protein